ncbi:hypothetical protein NBRC116594_39010 [Shimia sp. NS0008-38b]
MGQVPYCGTSIWDVSIASVLRLYCGGVILREGRCPWQIFDVLTSGYLGQEEKSVHSNTTICWVKNFDFFKAAQCQLTGDNKKGADDEKT